MSWLLLPPAEDETEDDNEFSGDEDHRLRHEYEFLQVLKLVVVLSIFCLIVS